VRFFETFFYPVWSFLKLLHKPKLCWRKQREGFWSWAMFVLLAVFRHRLENTLCANQLIAALKKCENWLFCDLLPSEQVLFRVLKTGTWSWLHSAWDWQAQYIFCSFVLWTNKCTQLFHKLSHRYMFRHYSVTLRQPVINTLHSYTSVSNAVVGNTIYS